MDFKVNMYLRQRWRDPRLASPNISTEGVLMNSQIKETWLPDLYLVNDKESYTTDVTMLNSFLRVNNLGDILYSLRVTAIVDCNMDLRHYPFDVQTCAVKFSSYGHTTSELIVSWADDDPVKVDKGIEMPEHVIEGLEVINCTAEYSIGWFSCISAEFKFRRNVTFYVIGLFIPSLLIVFLSWLAFWIDKASVPGRVSLSMITILTMQSQMGSVLSRLPSVSYIKIIDVWMAGCVITVFGGFMEYALVNHLACLEKEQKKRLFLQKETVQMDRLVCDRPILSDAKEKSTQTFGNVADKPAEFEIGLEDNNCKKRNGSDKIDYYSRILFPLSFLIFNIVVIAYYQLNQGANII
ncbi:glycine receptor subunit alpha-2-like [Watersipora subatra]|uniref:glycine receptor subunit alpha-2-like n=1 Tax=Watersipora subatra TaxID=2589382 RepID=UPI00355C8A6C